MLACGTTTCGTEYLAKFQTDPLTSKKLTMASVHILGKEDKEYFEDGKALAGRWKNPRYLIHPYAHVLPVQLATEQKELIKDVHTFLKQVPGVGLLSARWACWARGRVDDVDAPFGALFGCRV